MIPTRSNIRRHCKAKCGIDKMRNGHQVVARDADCDHRRHSPDQDDWHRLLPIELTSLNPGEQQTFLCKWA
jgi:hypothetical protein